MSLNLVLWTIFFRDVFINCKDISATHKGHFTKSHSEKSQIDLAFALKQAEQRFVMYRVQTLMIDRGGGVTCIPSIIKAVPKLVDGV